MTKGFVFATVLILLLSIWVGNSDYSEEVSINSEPCIGKDARLSLGSYFTQNQGQIPVDEVYFHSQNAYFSPTGVIFRVFEESNELTKDTQEPLAELSQPENMHVYEMRFIDANYVIPVCKEKLPHKSNYFLGNDPSKWAADVPNYREIIYENLYDNIDLVYRTVPQGLKYEFVVHPGGEVEHIKMKYKSVELSTDGSNLFLKTSVGTVTDGGLYSYQLEDAKKLQVESKIIVKDNIVYYDVDYDAEYTLVIDPLLYSTYIGGSGTDSSGSIKLDASKNAYVAGSTASPNFPTTTGAYNRTHNGRFDVYVLKLNAAGSGLIYSTFIGGNDDDIGKSMVLDSSNNAYVTGSTESPDFPTTKDAYNTTNSGYEDIFVLQLNSAGNNLVFSSYIGGSQNESGNSITIDTLKNAYVTGRTTSSDFPTTSGVYDRTFNNYTDAFVLKLNPAGNGLVFSTFIGGNSSDYGYSIAIDAKNNIYITGNTGLVTGLLDFPTTIGAYDTISNGRWDVFVLKLNSTGNNVLYSTFIGSDDDDCGLSIALDDLNNAYVTGYTYASTFPTTVGAYDTTYNGDPFDCYILKINFSTGNLVYSTFLGGSEFDIGFAIELYSYNNVYVTGRTISANFPVTPNAYDSTFNGLWEVFVTGLNLTSNKLTYSTYIGGTDSETGISMVINSPTDMYLAGNTESTDFPTSTSAYDPTFNGGWDDIFVLRLGIPSPPGPPANLNAWPGDNWVQLSWEPPSFNGYSSVTGYRIYRGFNKDYLSYLAATSSGKKNYIDTSVTDGIKYFYLISAVNSIGEGKNSTIVNATPGAPPSLPYNLVASPGDGVIQLSWDAPVDDNGFTITNYTIYRALPEENLSALNTLGNILEYTDTNVNNGITYSYSVSAHNMRGESLQSESISSTPGTIPSAPTNLMVEEGDSYVLLTWEPPVDNGWLKITNYRIYRGTDEYGLNMIKEIWNVLNYNDTTVTNGWTYYYSVSAVNAMGTGPRTEAVPAYPASLPGSPILSVMVEDGAVELYWENYDTTEQVISHYSIYKTIKHSFERIRINTTRTNYSDYDIINGVTYSYGVKAVNRIGESEISNIITITPQGPPSPPLNLTAVGGNEYVFLEWEASELTGGRWINEYRIYRGLTELDTSYLTYSLVEYYNDTDIENGVSYYYTVTAVNEIGESTRSEPVNVIPLGRPGNILNLLIRPGDGKVSFEWGQPLYDGGTEIQGYRIYKGFSETDLSFLCEVSELLYEDNSVTNGNTYYYKIVPFTDFSEGKLCEINSVIPYGFPGVPENLKIELVNGNVLLGWDPPPSDGGLSIERYKIYRKTKDFEFMELTSVDDLTYLDGNVLNGNEYYYKVSALNLIGEGETTEEISITVIKESKDGEEAPIYVLIIALSIIIILIIIISILIYRKKIKKKQQMTPQPDSTPPEKHQYPSESRDKNEHYDHYPTDWQSSRDNGPPPPPINPQQTFIPPTLESETRPYSPTRGYRQSSPGHEPYEEYEEDDF